MPPFSQSIRHAFRAVAAAALCLLGATEAALACTTMALGPAGQALIAYSYDQPVTGVGLLMVNPADAARVSLYDPPRASWQARYGSLTFNQAGQGMPTAGMNAQGLVVTLMWHDEGAYAAQDGRPRLNELEFIQYMLDTAATVDEALNAAQVHVDGMIPIQFFLADAAGDAATLAFVDGMPVATRGDALPIRALTNTSYATLVDGIGQFEPFGGDRPLPSVGVSSPTNLEDSLARFAHAALAADATAASVSANDAFAALESVQTPSTRWQIVFDPMRLEIHFRTTVTPERRVVRLAELDFGCRSRPLAFDVDTVDAGPIADVLRPLTEPQNRTIVRDTFGAFEQFDRFGPEFPAIVAAAQMETMVCAMR